MVNNEYDIDDKNSSYINCLNMFVTFHLFATKKNFIIFFNYIAYRKKSLTLIL